MERSLSRTLSLFSLCVTSASLTAGTMSQALTYPDGLSMAVGGGGMGYTNSGAYTSTAGAPSTANAVTARSYQLGGVGNIALGYGQHLGTPFYLGGELGLAIYGAKNLATSSTAQSNTTVTNTGLLPASTVNTYQVLSTRTTLSQNTWVPFFDLKPGIFVSNNQLIFARLGVNYNELKVRTDSTFYSQGILIDGAPDTLVDTTTNLLFIQKNTRIGLRTGLGIEYLLDEHLGLSANYVYSFYQAVNTSHSGLASQVACDVSEGCHVNSDGMYTANGHSKISDQEILLQLVYHFV